MAADAPAKRPHTIKKCIHGRVASRCRCRGPHEVQIVDCPPACHQAPHGCPMVADTSPVGAGLRFRAAIARALLPAYDSDNAQEWERMRADAVAVDILRHLDAEGWAILPPGSTAEQWAAVATDTGYTTDPAPTRQDAELTAYKFHWSPNQYRLQRRTLTTWPDGTALIAPWTAEEST